MKKLYLLFCIPLLLLINYPLISVYGYAGMARSKSDTTKSKTATKETTKITDTRKNKPDFLLNGVKFNFTPFKPVLKPAATSGAATKNPLAQEDGDKVLSDVKVFPNPVEDEINLTYKVNKDANVTIKIMDVLGNEIATLMSQKLIAGGQSNKFKIATRLNSGFYFLRLIVENEVVVKRISVL